MERSSLRRRVILFELLGVVTLVLLLAGTSLLPRTFAIAFAVGFVLLALYLMTLRCPNCRYPLLKRERRTSIGHLTVWMGWPARRCSRCGTSFSADTNGDAPTR